MTRRESRGLWVFGITLISLISGIIIAFINPSSWHWFALITIGVIGSYLCYIRWKLYTNSTPEERMATEEQDEETRQNIGVVILVAWVIVIFLSLLAIGVGIVLNLSIGGELGHTIIHYALIVAGIFAALFLGYLLFLS